MENIIAVLNKVQGGVIMMKKGVVATVSMVLFLMLSGYAIAGDYKLPDTGIDKCYDTGGQMTCPSSGRPFYGQDAQYYGPQLSYRDNGNGTVSDLNTGLMWQADDGYYKSKEAQDYCEGLNLGDYDDWRVPNISELFSIVKYGGAPPLIDTDYFFGTNPSSSYWSNTFVKSNYPNSVWIVYFRDGIVAWNGYLASSFVRCVRGTSQIFSYESNDKTVYDLVTGLNWQKADDGTERTWEKALEYCENLNLDGQSNWRLPNVKELQSIVNYDRSSPSIDPVFECLSDTYWSSSPLNEAYAWTANFVDGEIRQRLSYTSHYVRCVSGSISTPVTPAITSPTPESTLSSSTETFEWTSGADEYWLWVGSSAGTNDIHSSGSLGRNTSYTVNSLPTDGSKIYVRLWYKIGSDWKSTEDYTYKAFAVVAVPEITTPTPGSTLSSSTETFEWTSGADEYWLWIGSAAGMNDIYNSGSLGRNTSDTVYNLPTDGSQVYVRLYYNIGNSWKPKDYTYKAFTAVAIPEITSPTPSSTLSSSTETFEWTSGADEYWLWVGSAAGMNDIYNSGSLGRNTSDTVYNLPTDGSQVHVRLYYNFGNGWKPKDYTYTAYKNTSAIDYTITIKWWDDSAEGGLGDDKGIYKALIGARVELYDDNGLVGDDFLADGILNEHGSYTFENIISDDPGGPDLYVKIILESNEVKFFDYNLLYEKDTIRTPVEENVTKSLNIAYQLDREEQSTYAYVYSMIKQLHARWKKLTGDNEGIPQVKVKIILQQGDDPAKYPIISWYSYDLTSYILLGYRSNHDCSAWNRFVIAHEYAHHIMYKAYNNSMPDPKDIEGAHFLTRVTNEGFALGEGWAEFVQNAMFEDWQNDLNGTNLINGNYPLEWGTAHNNSDIENNSWWMGPDMKNNNGQIVEGAIASILWDIYDNNTDIEDEPNGGINNGLIKIWSVMKRYNPANIIDFYFDFIGEFPDAAKLDAIFDAHGINPHGVTGVTAGDVTGDGREEIIGSGSSGIHYYNVANSKWTSMSSYACNGDIASGDFTGDGRADVVSIWSSGLWYQNGATFSWTKVTSIVPYKLTSGDITGDGVEEIIGTWPSGFFYYDAANSKWTKMSAYLTTRDIASGDFTGDGKADVAACFSSGLYYQNSATLEWSALTSSEPMRVTAGDVTGDGRDDIIGTWSSGFWYYDVANSKWTSMSSYACNGDIASGDFTGDGRADVAANFSNGLWYQDGDTLAWKKVSD